MQRKLDAPTLNRCGILKLLIHKASKESLGHFLDTNSIPFTFFHDPKMEIDIVVEGDNIHRISVGLNTGALG